MSVIPCTLLAADDDTTNYLTHNLFQPTAVTNTLLTLATFFHSSLRGVDLENAWHGSNTISQDLRNGSYFKPQRGGISVVTGCKTTTKPCRGDTRLSFWQVSPPRGFIVLNQPITTDMPPRWGLKVEPVRKSCF